MGAGQSESADPCENASAVPVTDADSELVVLVYFSISLLSYSLCRSGRGSMCPKVLVVPVFYPLPLLLVDSDVDSAESFIHHWQLLFVPVSESCLRHIAAMPLYRTVIVSVNNASTDATAAAQRG